MKKKVLLFFATAMLSIMGAKADVIPSSYYSEPAAGTFYLYNVTQEKFLCGTGDPSLVSAPTTQVILAALSGDDAGKYSIQADGGKYYKMGYANSRYLWGNDWADNGFFKWTFSADGTKTYNLSITATANADGIFTNGNTYYTNGESGITETVGDANEWALITEANYYKYMADQSNIPSTYYTTTPSEGTYYLYNIENNGFICDGNNYVGLQTTPVALTLTSDGNGAFYIQLPDNGYIHTGFFDKYHVWADGATTAASGDYVANWTFESFYGVSGVFFIKSPEATVNGVTGNWHLHATGISNKGVNAWPTPDANRTNYAWALISEGNYTAWQNSFALNESTDFSIARDIYNVNPTVTKSMTAGVWNTFVVPFDMAIPSGWTVKEPTDFDGSTLTFSDASFIVAGKPYIVKPTEAVTSFSATGVTLKKDLSNTTVGTGTTVTMTGTYSNIDAIDYSTQDCYVIAIKNGVSALYHVNSAVSVKPFRAYFIVASGASVKANVINLDFDGETTGIQEIGQSDNLQFDNWYDLSGRRVAKPTRGLYIVNGKKVVIK